MRPRFRCRKKYWTGFKMTPFWRRFIGYPPLCKMIGGKWVYDERPWLYGNCDPPPPMAVLKRMSSASRYCRKTPSRSKARKSRTPRQ